MGALSLAFDITIVGTLALPWVLLVIHLFFSTNESGIKSLVEWVGKQNQSAVAGVLLFAMAYPLGSVVSRIAQDCFDDDDLRIYVFNRWFRVGVTESGIRADVYCHNLELPDGDPLADKLNQFQTNDPKCEYTGRWNVPKNHELWTEIRQQDELAGNIFYIQEGALLLKGTDNTERLRQFHDQIIVLRGAAFNGLVAFSLCLFWWSANLRFIWRWAVPVIYLLPGSIALYHHLFERAVGDPPYMEFTLLVLAAAGWYLLWQHRTRGKSAHEKLAAPNGKTEKPQPRFGYLVLAAFLTITTSLGWWATQVLYDQQVIYSYEAMSLQPPAK